MLVISAVLLLSLASASYGQASVQAFPSTQTIPLGKSVVLVCKAPGESSTLSYQWSCPGGNCDESTSTQGAPRSRIVNENTLTVNVVSESDAGEYNCTVTGGDSTQTASYTLDVEGGIAIYKQEAQTSLLVFPSGSVVLTTDGTSSGFYEVAIECYGPNSTSEQWFDPEGSALSTDHFAAIFQASGELFISNINDNDYANGNYKCMVGSEEAVLGLYFRTNVYQGTYGRKVANLTSTQSSSSSVRLSWNPLTRPESVTALGYFVSYGIADHGVKENVVVEGGSTTSVDLTSLQPGVEYEATVRGFSQSTDTMERLLSTESSISWIIPAVPPSPVPTMPTSPTPTQSTVAVPVPPSPTPTFNINQNPSQSTGVDSGTIVGVVVAVLFVLLILIAAAVGIGVAVFICKVKNEQKISAATPGSRYCVQKDEPI